MAATGLGVANHGSYVAVAAPGIDIFVAAPNGRYGLTVVTAHVSGGVALLIDRDPRLTPDAVQVIPDAHREGLGIEGRDTEYAADLVDAYGGCSPVRQKPPSALPPIEDSIFPPRRHGSWS